MPEFENRKDKSALENAKALKHNIIKSKIKSIKEEKWKDKTLRGQYPKDTGGGSCQYIHHQQMVIK